MALDQHEPQLKTASRHLVDDSGGTDEITPRERALGKKTFQLFLAKFHRDPAWSIDGNSQVSVLRGYDLRANMKVQGIRVPKRATFPELFERISIDGLDKEPISADLAASVDEGLRVERYLVDFDQWTTRLFRHDMGLTYGYFQWKFEEKNHSLVLATISERTQREKTESNPEGTSPHTPESLLDSYYKTIEKVWKPPFMTARQMLLYAAIQEINTYLSYGGMAKKADKEGALTAGKLIRLVQQDEGFHAAFFRAMAKLYYDDDPEGTIADTIYVAENYSMPALDLHDNSDERVKVTRSLARVGAFNKDMVARGSIYHTLRLLKFIPEEQARVIADNYWKKPQLVST